MQPIKYLTEAYATYILIASFSWIHFFPAQYEYKFQDVQLYLAKTQSAPYKYGNTLLVM